ncbi:MAG: hypothetical protein M3455_02100 [Actinomycetota bacterium]|nr:hypothetical protein [Actinomycetota bacterium]
MGLDGGSDQAASGLEVGRQGDLDVDTVGHLGKRLDQVRDRVDVIARREALAGHLHVPHAIQPEGAKIGTQVIATDEVPATSVVHDAIRIDRPLRVTAARRAVHEPDSPAQSRRGTKVGMDRRVDVAGPWDRSDHAEAVLQRPHPHPQGVGQHPQQLRQRAGTAAPMPNQWPTARPSVTPTASSAVSISGGEWANEGLGNTTEPHPGGEGAG